MEAKVEAIKHQDVRGKEMLYLKITKDGLQPLVINIGNKTFEALQALEGTTQAKLNIEQPKAEDNAMGDEKKVRGRNNG